MTGLKDWQHHIADVHADRKGLALCGERLVMTWHFQDIDHAFLSVAQESYHQPCPACARRVVEVFADSAAAVDGPGVGG